MSENPLWLRDSTGSSNQVTQNSQAQQNAQASLAEKNVKNARALYWLFKFITMGKNLDLF